jgi:hypothetical protein
MESPDELNVHKKWREGKGNFPQVESPDELQEELIKGGRGMSFKWSHRKARGKGFGMVACQSVIRA